MNSVFANFYKWNPNKFRVCYWPAQASDHLQHWCLLFCLSMFFWHLQAKVQIKSKPHYYYCITAIIVCQGSYILFSLPAEFNSFILKTIITIRKLNHYILTFEIKVLTMLAQFCIKILIFTHNLVIYLLSCIQEVFHFSVL